MKLASFSTSNLPQARLGLVQHDEIVDVDLAARALDLQPYEHMQGLLDHYEQGLAVLQAITRKAAGRRLRDVKTFSATGAAYALSQVELHAPIPRPRKNVMCLGRNYAEHAFESARTRGEKETVPEAPIFFTKAPTTINGPFGKLVIDPHVSTRIDWEVELAVIIGRDRKSTRLNSSHSQISYAVF